MPKYGMILIQFYNFFCNCRFIPSSEVEYVNRDVGPSQKNFEKDDEKARNIFAPKRCEHTLAVCEQLLCRKYEEIFCRIP